jgi:hypothetical protein
VRGGGRPLPGGDAVVAALLVMLASSMVPEAREKVGLPAGVITVLGFALAFALSKSP